MHHNDLQPQLQNESVRFCFGAIAAVQWRIKMTHETPLRAQPHHRFDLETAVALAKGKDLMFVCDDDLIRARNPQVAELQKSSRML